MTIMELLTEDRLFDAIAQQRSVVEAASDDSAARLTLFDLHVMAGQFLDASAVLKHFEISTPELQSYAYSLRRLLRAERRRQHGFKPDLLLEPPMHIRCRWHALKASRSQDVVKTSKWEDRAETRTPWVRGHVNGREFSGIRDLDDRFSSFLEFLQNGRYYWIPFEQIRKVVMGKVEGYLDNVLRPADIYLKGDVMYRGHLPLVYPGTSLAKRDESFILGRDTDFTEAAGLVMGIGDRVMSIGEEEISLSEVQQLEIK